MASQRNSALLIVTASPKPTPRNMDDYMTILNKGSIISGHD